LFASAVWKSCLRSNEERLKIKIKIPGTSVMVFAALFLTQMTAFRLLLGYGAQAARRAPVQNGCTSLGTRVVVPWVLLLGPTSVVTVTFSNAL
jgi:hypothetical protein